MPEEDATVSVEPLELEEVPTLSSNIKTPRHRRSRVPTSHQEQIDRNEKELMNHRFLETKQQLNDLQVKHMTAKIAEAEEEARFKKEEAKLRMEEARLRTEEARLRTEEARLKMEEARIRTELAKRELDKQSYS